MKQTEVESDNKSHVDLALEHCGKRAETRCLKITEKVSFNTVSEVRYIYILSGKKFIQTPKNGSFGDFLKI